MTIRIKLELVKDAILNIIKESPIPEDPTHAEDTLRWLLLLHPQADECLKVAAFGHDIERGSKATLRGKDFPSYDDFKVVHATKGAQIMENLLRTFDIDQEDILDVTGLIRLHEVGGNTRADYLKWADSLSFFSNNLPLFKQRHTKEEIEYRISWGLKRIPENLHYLVST
jgi:hypothetical protein